MQKQLITLYSHIHFAIDDGGVVPSRSVTAFNTEVAIFGYTFDKDTMMQLGRLSPLGFATVRADILKTLEIVSGEGRQHAVLFNGFPYDTPKQYDYLIRRVIGWLQDYHDIQPENARILSCGHVIDPTLFDLGEFGACPICQFQVDELDSPEKVQHEFKRMTALKVLSYADDDYLRGRTCVLLARNSSLSADEKAFLLSVLRTPGMRIDLPETVFREHLPFVYDALVHRQPQDKSDLVAVRRRMSSATDVLRIAAFLSDDNADLSLKEPVKFKLSTRDRKNLMALLESLDDILEDLLRRRERWLRLGERLNPGTARNRRRYPKVAEAFHRLRNEPEAIATFNRSVESSLRAGNVDPMLLAMMLRRPGEFLRRLDVMLRRTDEPELVMAALPVAAENATTKMLIELRKYLMHRNEVSGTRVFLPKGRSTKIQVVEDRRPEIPAGILNRSIGTLETELNRRFQAMPPWGRVYIDPALDNIVLPFNRRGDSSTNTDVVKGSRYPLEAEDVVRMFVHWTGRIDVDLSVVFYDDRFTMLNYISWQNFYGSSTLHRWNCVHSGDIQSAPKGASEFIDFEISNILSNGARYAVMSVIVYSGDAFGQFPCFAGFMARDALKSGRRYEPSEVALKFDISANTRSHTPLIFDLVERQMIFADMASGQRYFSTVETDQPKLVATAKAALNLAKTKPTVHDVLSLHARARGIVVSTPREADTVFTLDGLDLDAILALTA